MKDCIDKKCCFIDYEFPHNIMSITLNKKHIYYKHFENAIWLRPPEIFNTDYNNINLFEEIKPDNII